jgi:hypothetical protein
LDGFSEVRIRIRQDCRFYGSGGVGQRKPGHLRAFLRGTQTHVGDDCADAGRRFVRIIDQLGVAGNAEFFRHSACFSSSSGLAVK